MEIKTADEVINMIAETLRQADDDFILKIARMVLTENIKNTIDGFKIYPKETKNY